MAPVAGASLELDRHLERIGQRVDALTSAVDELRGLLEAGGIVLPHWQSYRLAVTLMRVDEAAAALVMWNARAEERELAGVLVVAFPEADVEGQLPAFPELEEFPGLDS
jgi:hypothetical protein